MRLLALLRLAYLLHRVRWTRDKYDAALDDLAAFAEQHRIGRFAE
jgi:hypothetical protein